jgi:hypothetical protein
VRHSRLSLEHEALLQALAHELRVGRVCGRASGFYPATDLLVRYDLYGVSVAFRFRQEDILTTSPGTLAHGAESIFTRAILKKLWKGAPTEDAEAASHPISEMERQIREAWNRSLYRGF